MERREQEGKRWEGEIRDLKEGMERYLTGRQEKGGRRKAKQRNKRKNFNFQTMMEKRYFEEGKS
jgi:hypothetical protein